MQYKVLEVLIFGYFFFKMISKSSKLGVKFGDMRKKV